MHPIVCAIPRPPRSFAAALGVVVQYDNPARLHRVDTRSYVNMPNIRIVIADDQPLMRQAVRQSLEAEEDMEVLGEAADGQGAVELARRLDPDVLLVEVMMPRLGGLEVTRTIKQACPAISVLVLTDRGESQHVLRLLGAGASGYLLKTVSPEALVHAIRSVFSGGTVIHPAIRDALLRRVVKPPERTEPRDLPGAPDRLTSREADVLRLAATGMRNEGIAARLGIAERTVKGHMGNIFAKLQVESRTEAVYQAANLGYIRIEDRGS